ncbi:twin-arginine translocation signal domain-containing protein [Pectinatus frisingensis]|uniref:twin-arginine translocation signal domain-containing protein n=1 Tax=Pectinatus frisingensis TaxID=865 RepID=UPI0018C55D3B|nr:twin-arginine translocation signal domain-containing protein [Pectinatus frisingensis]
MKRRDFLKLTGIGAILSGCGIIFIPQVKQIIQITKTIASRYQMTNNAAVFNLHQVITSDITKSRTIMWQSKSNEPDAIVALQPLFLKIAGIAVSSYYARMKDKNHL